jgi:hypothetical protein
MTMMFLAIRVMMMTMLTVGAALGLKRNVCPRQFRPEAAKHFLDDMVRTNAKRMIANLCGQVPISQVPGKAHKLTAILMSDFHSQLWCGLNPEPPPVFQLQTISVSHCNCMRKIEQ